MARQGGLRQRKKEQTRQRIESAARRLFARDGFEAVTIAAIAGAANIAPRTFFHYFPTKEDVALADYARRLAQLIDEVDARPPDEEPWKALRAAFVVVAADYEEHLEQILDQFQIMAGSSSVQARSLQLQAQCEDSLSASMARRRGADPDDDLPSRLLASSALGAMRSSLHQWMLSGRREPLPVLLEFCFDELETGLAHLRTNGR